MSPPGTRRLDVTCDHVTTALQAMHRFRGVRSATVFGQSMHLLVDERFLRTRDREHACAASAIGMPKFTRLDRHWKMFS